MQRPLEQPFGNLQRAMRLDRRQLLRFAGAAAAVGSLPGGAWSSTTCDRVVVGTWGGDFARTIEATIGANVKHVTGAEFVADVGAAGPRKARLLAERTRPRGSTDIVCLDGLDMHQMADQDLLHEIQRSDVPNLANVYPAFSRSYAVPQSFSAKVIVYNPEKMPAPKSFRDLWKGAYAGKIGLADLLAISAIESAAMINGGHAGNYEPGKDKLLELKASGVKLYPSNEALATALAAGDIWATIMWRARAQQWKKSGLPVENVCPEEGATPVTFEVGAPRNGSSRQCAMAFLNQTLDPSVQVEFAARMGYCPTVENAPLQPQIAAGIDFTPEERANFFKQDFAYLDQNQTQLLDWWTRIFKA